jgi:hypothetical protein
MVPFRLAGRCSDTVDCGAQLLNKPARVVTVSSLVMFDLEIKRVRQRWEWRVCDRRLTTLARGRETTRREASYKAYRALFLLLASAGVCPGFSLDSLRGGGMPTELRRPVVFSAESLGGTL